MSFMDLDKVMVRLLAISMLFISFCDWRSIFLATLLKSELGFDGCFALLLVVMVLGLLGESWSTDLASVFCCGFWLRRSLGWGIDSFVCLDLSVWILNISKILEKNTIKEEVVGLPSVRPRFAGKCGRQSRDLTQSHQTHTWDELE